MTHSTPNRPPRSPSSTVASPASLVSFDSLASLDNPFLEAQRAQWEALVSWQQSLAAFNNDLWEQWAMHYAGGMPIDG
jgi:hypothetical protein